MKNLLPSSIVFAVLAAFFFSTAESQARAYGVTRGGRAVAAGPRGVAVAGPNGVAVTRRGYVRPGLPGGYIRVLPGGYRPVFYGRYNCYFVGGVYYRTVIYGGETVYVIVN